MMYLLFYSIQLRVQITQKVGNIVLVIVPLKILNLYEI